MSLKDKHTKQLIAMLDVQRWSDSITYKYDEAYASRFEDTGHTLEEIKAELATREHVPNKAEAKAIRQQKAREKKNR